MQGIIVRDSGKRQTAALIGSRVQLNSWILAQIRCRSARRRPTNLPQSLGKVLVGRGDAAAATVSSLRDLQTFDSKHKRT